MKDALPYLWIFGCSLGASLVLTRLVVALCRRVGHVAPEDPFHSKPVALSAGIAIWLAVAPVLIFTLDWNRSTIGLAVGATAMLLVGLIDDLRPFRADVKLLLQFAVAIGLIASGIEVRLIPWPALAIPITILWIVGLTNAVNLIDNMDGLAPGVCAIAALFLGILSLQKGDATVATIGFALAGACAGFLTFNFPPARAFLGDTGSMFLGCALAATGILSTRVEASTVMLTLAAPVLVLLVPIFNTTFVAVTRMLLGRSVSAARPDHINFRLIAHGLSQRRSIWMIYGFAAAGGALAVAYDGLGNEVLIASAMLGTILLFIVGVFLVDGDISDLLERFHIEPDGTIAGDLRRYRSVTLFLIDLILVTAAYYCTYLIRFEGNLPDFQLVNFAQTLPMFLIIRMACFSFFGLYSLHWRYVGMTDIVAVIKAVAISSLLQIGVVYLLAVPSFSRSVIILDAILLVLLLSGVRMSTGLLRAYVHQFRQHLPHRRRTIILGAGDGGDLAVRELTNNPAHDLIAVGFLDDDAGKRHSRIHGLPVLGSMADLGEVAERRGITDVLVAIPSASTVRVRELIRLAQAHDLVCHVFQIRSAVVRVGSETAEFEVLDGGRRA
jgi:UDP-GlcNAc:undecaprenyl-phosphate GlcNAc-1-phosphate transferase